MEQDALETPTARAAFNALFERHHRAVLAYALRRSQSTSDAEDVAAETFAIAWRRFHVIPAHALPWLYGVARRVLANQRRGLERHARLIDRMRTVRGPVDSGTDGHDGAATAALTRLRPDDQELLRLVAWEELDHSEIATILGITTNAVAIRFHRARRRFADALAVIHAEAKGSTENRTQAPVTGRNVAAARHEDMP